MPTIAARLLRLVLLTLGLAGQTLNAAPGPGIPLELAGERSARLSAIEYRLHLDLPAQRTAPIAGRMDLRFNLSDTRAPLHLDFSAPDEHLHTLRINGRQIPPRIVHGHIELPRHLLRRGRNQVALGFRAGDAPLNRQEEFLYSLFVPARASETLPLFDQPDLKARWRLTLDLPASWRALSNAPQRTRSVRGERARIRFATSAPLPSYLFAFTAGSYAVEELVAGGRTMRMYHLEKDPARLARNRDAIAQLHAEALAWLEDYTAIPYPYGKFDFALIPSFQFGGMEHPGAIFYKAASLLLDESASQERLLRRAHLIAHETAHMWFGDLVTMRWFDDVWMKEVFANLMAAKIVNPAFPELDHDLRFLLQHHPAAYEVDRTAGANPIRQPLANLNEAGSLYGAIIYQKAPVALRQLETLAGETPFRAALREYLRRHAHGNADWPQLIEILSRHSGRDLSAWSADWIESRGRPRLDFAPEPGRGRLAIRVADPLGLGRRWPQILELELGYAAAAQRQRIALNGSTELMLAADQGGLRYLLPDAAGLAYADFVLPPPWLDALAMALPELSTARARGSALVLLWENLLAGRWSPEAFGASLRLNLTRESDPLLRQQWLTYLSPWYWHWLSPTQRDALAPALEAELRAGLASAADTRERAAWFAALVQIATTPASVDWLNRVWQRAESIPGLPLGESDETTLALELAVRGVADAESLLQTQLQRVKDPDRRAMLEFAQPALAGDVALRRRFMTSLAQPAMRRREDWVVLALSYLNHPLRAATAEAWLPEALGLLPEIRASGDIFFAKRWADAVLGGHHASSAARTVAAHLADLPADYPPRLRWLLQASADPLLRRAGLTGE